MRLLSVCRRLVLTILIVRIRVTRTGIVRQAAGIPVKVAPEKASHKIRKSAATILLTVLRFGRVLLRQFYNAAAVANAIAPRGQKTRGAPNVDATR